MRTKTCTVLWGILTGVLTDAETFLVFRLSSICLQQSQCKTAGLIGDSLCKQVDQVNSSQARIREGFGGFVKKTRNWCASASTQSAGDQMLIITIILECGVCGCPQISTNLSAYFALYYVINCAPCTNVQIFMTV